MSLCSVDLQVAHGLTYWIIHDFRIISSEALGQASYEVLYVLHDMIYRSVLRQSERESEPSRKLFWRSSSSSSNCCQRMRALWLLRLPTAIYQVVGGLNKKDQLLPTPLPSAQLTLIWPLEPVELHQVEANKGMCPKYFCRTSAVIMKCDVTSFLVWKSWLWRGSWGKKLTYLTPSSSLVLLQKWYKHMYM